MVESKENVTSHFSKKAEEYRKTIDSANNQFYKNIGLELNKDLTGIVLDIGNGSRLISLS